MSVYLLLFMYSLLFIILQFFFLFELNQKNSEMTLYYNLDVQHWNSNTSNPERDMVLSSAAIFNYWLGFRLPNDLRSDPDSPDLIVA